MSKLRVSLAGLFMLILISMFSAVAFADFTPTSTNPAPGINVGSVDNFGNQSTHKTHGNFQNNTNSCANCHSTHSGVNSQLLMTDGEYNLCMSCHDGTLGFYDVEKASGAGIFDSTHMSASMHNVNSGVKVNTAPGSYNNGAKDTVSLECSSCHNPHGSVNDRLLKENVIDVTPFAKTANGFVAAGTKTINLKLTDDPQFKAINDLTGTGGLKVQISEGPLNATDKTYYAQFCGACHNDYLSSRSSSATTRPSNIAKTAAGGHDYLYTHTANSSSQGRSCAACHYAHGTDVTTMMDTQGKKVDYYVDVKGWSEEKAENYMKDVSARGSSSLKKFTNLTVCWTCHQSTHKIDTSPVDPQFLDPATGAFPGKTSIK